MPGGSVCKGYTVKQRTMHPRIAERRHVLLTIFHNTIQIQWPNTSTVNNNKYMNMVIILSVIYQVRGKKQK
jgi:hypothetical protein